VKALITQREQVDKYGVSIDVLESKYIIFFESLGINIIPVSNFSLNITRILNDEDIDLIILSGGGDLILEKNKNELTSYCQFNRDFIEVTLMEYALKNDIPVLGICRGMEHMNTHLGGNLSNLASLNIKHPVGQEHSIKLSSGENIYVNSFHNEGLLRDDLSPEFDIYGINIESTVIESIYSKKLNWLGVQWHPEREILKEFSKKVSTQLIKNFIEKKL
jgi:gamma-glutamyl-gamma-aminobutyrate hydrolase PuuD